MASLLVPANEAGGRISQLLPTVKCSSCNEPVPLAELGEHICKPQGPAQLPLASTPSVPFPKTAPPTSIAVPLPQAPKPPAAAGNATHQPQQGRGSPVPPVFNPPTPNYPRSASTPPRQPLVPAVPPPQRYGTPAGDRPRFNTNPAPPSSYQPRSSPLARREPEEEDPLRPRDPFAPNTGPPRPIPAADIRARAASNAGPPLNQPQMNAPRGPGSSPLNPGIPDARARTMSSASQMHYTPAPISQRPLPSSPLVPNPAPGARRPSFNAARDTQRPPMPPPVSASAMPNPPPPMVGTPSSMPPRRSPMPAHPGSSMTPAIPPFMGTPMTFSAQLPPGTPIPDLKELGPIDTKTGGEAGMAGVGRRGFAAAARAAMFATTPNQQLHAPQPGRAQPPRFLDLDAASRSTETPPLSAGSGYSSHSPGLTSPFPQSPVSPGPNSSATPTPPSSLPSDVEPKPINNKRPPPLNLGASEPSSTTVDTAPATPLSARMPFFDRFKNKLPSINTAVPNNLSNNISTSNSPNGAVVASPNEKMSDSIVSPAESASSYYSRKSANSTASRSPNTSTRSSRRKFSINNKTIVNGGEVKKDLDPPMSPSSGSEYGLAYADSDKEDEEEDDRVSKVTTPVPGRSRSILRNGTKSSNNDNTHVRFPSGSTDRTRKPERKDSLGSESTTSRSSFDRQRTGGGSGNLERSTSAASSRSAFSRVASVHGGIGALDRAMETLQEEDTGKPLPSPWDTEFSSEVTSPTSLSRNRSGSVATGQEISISPVMSGTDNGPAYSNGLVPPTPGGSTSKRSNTVQGSPETRASIKLPMRSKTSPSIGDGNRDPTDARKERRLRRTKDCLKCDAKIEDGRWIQVDAGGVLCEKCWKNMYLPKCRRCNLPIEKQAVSSSDGQLKGKYHRECFNCHKCHKPFPDKTFYVFDGKPLCAYHYHEANDSLCAAASCGQPIEGPCAVSHTGDKYHPEHLTCEYAGHPRCNEKLVEYWEIDGRMLCEKHANTSSNNNGSDDDEEDDVHYAYSYGFGDESEGRSSRSDIEEWRQRGSRATKRVTRFIDLASALGGSDLR
ncbi:hypothetical protein AX16_001591 [Volvariella volvacea WC 439]|nr:hypothetical protein AX16_001591 [Volvariella volvacea WC 439]